MLAALSVHVEKRLRGVGFVQVKESRSVEQDGVRSRDTEISEAVAPQLAQRETT
jgi:hypothetical protein